VGSVLAGQELNRVYHGRKKRLDLMIVGPALHQILQNVLGRPVAPAVYKAFNFQGFRFDRFLIVRYAADRENRFRTHRDKLSPEAEDRRFVMTLNLNGDAYEGGRLVFPEYGPDQYNPGNGRVVVFSCSLLHEALPVTKRGALRIADFLAFAFFPCCLIEQVDAGPRYQDHSNDSRSIRRIGKKSEAPERGKDEITVVESRNDRRWR